MSRQLSTPQKSESVKTLVLSAISELVVFQDLEQKIIWANQAAVDSLNISLSDLVGRSCYEAWHHRNSPCDECPIVKARETGEPQKAEIKTPDGRIWLIRGYPVWGENKQIMGMVEVTLEITQRKKVEDALKESEAKYKTLIQTSPASVTVTDVSGKITYVSQQTLQLHGFNSEEELIGKEFFDLIAPESRAQAIIYLRKTMKEGITRNLEYSLLRKTGEQFVGEIDTAVIPDAYGKPVSFIATTRDITQRKHIQDQLKASIREKEFLLQEIHHRVKNNLQVISSILDMSSLRTEDPCALDLIENARSKIQTMAFIHSQLYRSERFDQIEMGEHIRELVSYLKAVYSGGKDIRFHVDISEVYLSLTQAIPCALVLNELVSNAFKHAFKRKRSGNIVIAMEIAAGNTIVINVKDDGAGVPKEFELSRTETLGLKLVRNLVEKQLKGKIRLTRKKYTEFHMTFPLENKEE
jgi:PAS domain S-box-containing protein